MTRTEDQRAVIESTRLRILQVILATDWASLSKPEIAYRIPFTEEEIDESLREMEARYPPFVVVLEVPVEKREPGMPSTFYAVSEYGMELLKEVGMYDVITILYQVFQRMERDGRVQKIEEFPHRPTLLC